MQVILPQTSSEKLEAKERFNEMKLSVFFKMRNISEETQKQLLSMSSLELLDLAINGEQFKKMLQFGDPAWDKFATEERNFFELAQFMENREKYIHKLQQAEA